MINKLNKVLRLIVWLLLGAAMTGCRGQVWQDQADQRELRRLFAIPESAQLIEYHGFPDRSGFGQREGLSIRAVYQLKPAEALQITQNSAQPGWLALPIAPALRAQIVWTDSDLPQSQTGFYFCRTAGDDVLHATRTQACADTPPTSDLILGILELPSNRLAVMVRSAY